jgi:hypothetical protein
VVFDTKAKSGGIRVATEHGVVGHGPGGKKECWAPFGTCTHNSDNTTLSRKLRAVRQQALSGVFDAENCGKITQKQVQVKMLEHNANGRRKRKCQKNIVPVDLPPALGVEQEKEEGGQGCAHVVGRPELGWMQFLCQRARSKAENVPDEVSEWQRGGVPLLCLFGDCHQLPPVGRKCHFNDSPPTGEPQEADSLGKTAFHLFRNPSADPTQETAVTVVVDETIRQTDP